MPETVDRRGFVIGFADLVVIRMRFNELPFVDAVDRNAAHANRPLSPENGDGAFQVLRIGQHGDVDRAHRAVAPAQRRHAGVLGFDAAAPAWPVGVDAFDRADQPVQQVHVLAWPHQFMNAAAVPFHLPRQRRRRNTPAAGVQKTLTRHHVDTAEAALLDGLLDQLQGGALRRFCLTTNRRTPASSQALTMRLQSFSQAAMGFSLTHVATGLGHFDGLPGVQAGRGASTSASAFP